MESRSLALCYWDPSNAEHLEQAPSINCLQSSPLSLSVQQRSRVHKLTYASPPFTHPVDFTTFHTSLSHYSSSHRSVGIREELQRILLKIVGNIQELGTSGVQNSMNSIYLCRDSSMRHLTLIAFHNSYLKETEFVFLKCSPKNFIYVIINITIMLFQTCIVFFCETQMMIFWRTLLETKTPFALVCFSLKTHNFCYRYASFTLLRRFQGRKRTLLKTLQTLF